MTFYVLILESFLGFTYRHKLKHSLLGVTRKMVLLKFENVREMSDIDEIFCKLDYYVFIYYST